MRALGEGYLAAGHEPVLVVPGPSYLDEYTEQGRVIWLPGPVLPFAGGGYRVLVNRMRLASVLDELAPDRLEVSDRTTLRWTGAWARRRGVPSVMVSHESVAGLLGLAGRTLPPPAGRRLADALNARTAKSFTRVVCTTDWAAQEFERIGVANLARVPLGVDLDLFSPRQRSMAVRERYAHADEVLLVHCGRLSVEKKPERSIEALAALRAAGVPAVLVVAGDGPLHKRLARQSEGLPVTFAGFVHDRTALAALLAAADAVLAPGPVETFGLAALEALASGTPVVVSASSALPEVVGDAGIAVEGEDFADGLSSVLARPVVERRLAARRRAEEFGWPAAVRGFLAAHGLPVPPLPLAAPPSAVGSAPAGGLSPPTADLSGVVW